MKANTQRTVIKEARIICPEQGLDTVGDIGLANGVINQVSLGTPIDGDGAAVIEAEGKIVCPGFIDLHATSGEPGYEYREDLSETAAAAVRGGFCTVCIAANGESNNDTRPMVEYFVRRSREIGSARLVPIGALTKDRKGERLTEMFDLRQGGAAGFGDGVSDFADAGLMRRALEYASATGLPVFEFPNNPSLSAGGVMHEGAVSTRLGLKGVPRAAEEARVYRAIALVRLTGAAVHLGPISAAASVEAIRRAKVEGLPVTCAVTAAHLRFIDEDIEAGWSTCLKVMPVLRAKEDREALIEGLRDGTIDAIATGHGAMGLVDKQVPFPKAEFGMLGLQTALGIALELSQAGGLSMARILGALSVGPARCLRQALPIIQKGRPADLVMFDPSEETVFTAEEIQSKAVNTPYLGQSLPGRIHGTWVDGLRVFPTQAPKSTEERK